MNELDLFTNLAFPVALCIVLIYYIKTLHQTLNNTHDSTHKELVELIKTTTNALSTFTHELDELKKLLDDFNKRIEEASRHPN